jgi:Winged helix-turn-helix DNA-binding
MRHTPQRRHADLPTSERSHPDAPAPVAPLMWTECSEWSGWSLLPGQLHHVDHRWLRSINRALVLACLREHGPISRVAIAERTALSRTTVSAITNALLHEGIICEGERLPAATQGGRRAVLLHAIECRDIRPETPAKEP